MVPRYSRYLGSRADPETCPEHSSNGLFEGLRVRARVLIFLRGYPLTKLCLHDEQKKKLVLHQLIFFLFFPIFNVFRTLGLCGRAFYQRARSLLLRSIRDRQDERQSGIIKTTKAKFRAGCNDDGTYAQLKLPASRPAELKSIRHQHACVGARSSVWGHGFFNGARVHSRRTGRFRLAKAFPSYADE